MRTLLGSFGFGAVACFIFIAGGAYEANSGPERAVQRGWFEHQGKIYRVVPAEVR